MRVIDFLSLQLDRELTEPEKQAAQSVFPQHIEFWELCFEARRILIEEKQIKEKESDVKNKRG